MSGPMHTPGPWGVVPGHSVLDIVAGGGAIATTTGGVYWEPYSGVQEANARRIVDCVNACEGIADPSVVPELVAALEEARDSLAFAHKELTARGLIPQEDAQLLSDRIVDASTALAKIGGDA